MMMYSAKQVLEVVEISSQTLRYWKSKLGPLSKQKAYAAQFTAHDIVALCVVRVLVKDFCVDVQRLSAVSDELFAACRQPVWGAQVNLYLVLDLLAPQIAALPVTDALVIQSPAIVVPLAPIAGRVQAKLMGGQPLGQRELPLRPAVVARG